MRSQGVMWDLNTYGLHPIALIACGVRPNLRHNSIWNQSLDSKYIEMEFHFDHVVPNWFLYWILIFSFQTKVMRVSKIYEMPQNWKYAWKRALMIVFVLLGYFLSYWSRYYRRFDWWAGYHVMFRHVIQSLDPAWPSEPYRLDNNFLLTNDRQWASNIWEFHFRTKKYRGWKAL